MSRILAIDYGERRIGLALSDPLGIIAKPLKVIDVKYDPEYLLTIEQLVNEYSIQKIIVGLPLTLKGGYSKQTNIIIDFIEVLKNKITVPIVKVDERLSSLAAKKSLIDQGIDLKFNKGEIDKTAAAIILQEYLDSN